MSGRAPYVPLFPVINLRGRVTSVHQRAAARNRSYAEPSPHTNSKMRDLSRMLSLHVRQEWADLPKAEQEPTIKGQPLGCPQVSLARLNSPTKAQKTGHSETRLAVSGMEDRQGVCRSSGARRDLSCRRPFRYRRSV